MPRPIKCRKVCHFPDILEFRPSNENGGRGEEDEKEVILLTVDEYETIRLIDKEGYSQEQCAGFMQIARTTVQRIYEIARKKVADAIIDGHPLSRSAMVKVVNVVWVDATNKNFIKSMQQKKEKV